MQAQFIYYKTKFMFLELRHKLTRVLIRLLVKNTHKIKPINATQLNPRPNTLNFIELEKIVGFIGLEFSQAEYVELV